MPSNPELLKIYADHRMAELRQEAELERQVRRESGLLKWLKAAVPSSLEATR